MRIGIIGAGNIGGALVRRLRAAGHDVAVANSRGPATLAALAAETGAQAVTVAEAARGRDVVVVTIPEKSVAGLPKDLFDGEPADLVIVDTGNYYPRQRDGRIDAIEQGTPESRWVADQLGRPVVKAFNNVHAARLEAGGPPAGTPGRMGLPAAGDDARAKATVIALMSDIGFDGVDAGPLDESWRQQPDTPVYGAEADADGVRRLLAAARPGRPAAFSAPPAR